MASGTQVPWTSVGGTPCCCTSCTNNEIAQAYGSVPSTFASVTLDEATFAAIRISGIRVLVSFNLSVGSGGSLLPFGQDYTTISTIPYTGCRFQFQPSTGFLLYQSALGWTYEVDFFLSFNIFIQDGGTGWPSSPSAPSTSNPVLFLSGLTEPGSVFLRIGSVRGIGAAPPLSGLSGFRAAWGNQYGGSGSAQFTTNIFGQFNAATTSATSGVSAPIAVNITLPPP